MIFPQRAKTTWKSKQFSPVRFDLTPLFPFFFSLFFLSYWQSPRKNPAQEKWWKKLYELIARMKRYYDVIFDQKHLTFAVVLIAISILIYTCFIELDRMWNLRRCRTFWQLVCFTGFDLIYRTPREHFTSFKGTSYLQYFLFGNIAMARNRGVVRWSNKHYKNIQALQGFAARPAVRGCRKEVTPSAISELPARQTKIFGIFWNTLGVFSICTFLTVNTQGWWSNFSDYFTRRR